MNPQPALFALFAATAVSLSSHAHAQARHGVHPWIANIDSNFNSEILGESLLFNRHNDGIWNYGEGFLRFGGQGPEDTGGYLQPYDGTQLVDTDIHVQIPPGATGACAWLETITRTWNEESLRES